MEIEIKEGNGIHPETIADAGKMVCTIRKGTPDGDTVEETERTAKNGGTFKQYALFLKSGEDDLMLQYLFGKQLKECLSKFGQETKNWVGRKVELTAKKRGKYFDVAIKPI